MRGVLIGGGGFLLAVLWMDLLFDVQTLAHPRRAGDVPERVLASIAAYYRRVTTEAVPMAHLIGLVMLLTLGGAVLDLARGDGPLPPRLAAVALAGGPIGLAAARVFPNAVRLGARTDPPGEQSRLARAICRDHLLCLAGIALFVALQLARA